MKRNSATADAAAKAVLDASTNAKDVSPATFDANATRSEFAPPTIEKRDAEIDVPTAKARIRLLIANLLVLFGLWYFGPSDKPTTSATHILTPLFLLPVFDLFIAFVHMTMDNPLLLKHPWFGAMAYDFQEHHIEPWKCAVWPAWYQVTEALPGSLFFAIYALPLQYWWGVSLLPFAVWTMCLSVLNQYTHRFCHMSPPQRPKWMSLLASCGIVNKPETHALHHQTLDQAYAILNGISNPVVSYLTKHWRGALHPGWPLYTVLYGLTIPFLYGFFVLRVSAL